MAAPGSLTPADLLEYEAAVGRSAVETTTLGAETAARFARTLGDAHFDLDDTLPLGRQWGFFLPRPTRSGTGPDGHPQRGGFIPAIRLERRMFAGGSMERLGALRLDAPAMKTTTIDSITKKDGAAGELVFVEISSVFAQDAEPVLREKQTIVYLNPGAAQAAPLPGNDLPIGEVVEDWTPDTVDLFRFSAVTFNGHRIHYDRRYATEVEGYPDLVVHGPLIASKLLDLAMRTVGANAREFTFRARAPAFVDQPLRFIADRSDDGFELKAVRCDGSLAMTARAGF